VSALQVGIDMGIVAGGAPAKLDIEELLATRLLVQGNSGSGKSHLLRRLLEQSAPWVQQVVIDPEGDFVTLSDKFGHVVVDGERTEAELAGIANRIRQHRVSCVLTLEGLDLEEQMRAASAFLNGLFDADREFWYPVLVVVDEAQMFAPSVGGDVSEDARKLSLGAMTNLMCRGRKRGLAGVIATQRLAKLAKNVAAEASNFLMGRTFRPRSGSVPPAAADRHRHRRDVCPVFEPETDAAAGCAAGCRGSDFHSGSGGVYPACRSQGAAGAPSDDGHIGRAFALHAGCLAGASGAACHPTGFVARRA
jgi:DNA helicase HerA-like ATPase